MVDVLDLAARVIDSGRADVPVNRITQELSELDDGIALVESFSHSVAIRTADGLVVFDTSGVATGGRVVEAFRRWSSEPFHSVVYTHGHLDHVGGSAAFVHDASSHGRARPVFIGHEAVASRLDRYRMTDRWNLIINRRQFGWIAGDPLADGIGGRLERFLPDDVAYPDRTYRSVETVAVGGVDFELHHGRGETDDHTWAWVPARRTILCGDFLIWNFPNAGNPQKVQRYPLEWAQALRAMAALPAELLVPAHGLPIPGRDRIERVLIDVATTLENLVEEVVAMMNEGATLDQIVHTVKVPEETLARPYLRPLYDEPEFVVRNIWRLYGGWWDGNPARLKPPPDDRQAAEVAALAGGAGVLAARASELAEAGDLRMACQLAEWAAQSAPDDPAVHAVRAAVYEARRRAESSLMAKGIYAGAARESAKLSRPEPGSPDQTVTAGQP